MIVFGLDASTKTAGYALVEDRVPLEMSWIDLSKLETNKDKAHAVANFILNHPQYKNIEKIVLESPVIGFSRGATSQQTIATLIRFNGILEYVLQDKTNLKVELITSMQARKKALGKAFVKGLKPKEYVKTRLDQMYDLSKFQKINRIGNEDVHMGDARDGLVLALC